MQAQIKVMLELQERINGKVNPDWREKGFEWYRAIWIECAELLDHYGWKWWKKQSPDIEQVQLELIDVWHFGLSILLQSGIDSDQLAEQVSRELVIATDESDFRLDLESFAALVLSTRNFSVADFGRLLAGVGMDFDSLYRGYVGKNVLNFFRQDHGYQDGTYTKIWNGQEDNEHLVDVVRTLDAASASFSEDLYHALERRYTAPSA